MGNIMLFEVTDSWYVKDRGLVLVYDSPLASLAGQKRLRDTIVVVQPDQTRSEHDAVIEAAHFSMDGPSKYGFVVMLPDATPGSIRRGSQVFGGEAAAAMLLGKDL